MNDCIGFQRHRSMSRHAAGCKLDGPWNLLHGLNAGVLDLTTLAHNASAFCQAEFRVDFREMLFHHELNADASGAFFAAFKKEDDIAVERNTLAFQRERSHERCRHIVFVIDGSSSVDISAIASRRK